MTRNVCSRRLVISANRVLMDHYFHPLNFTLHFGCVSSESNSLPSLERSLLLWCSCSPSRRKVSLQQLYKVLSRRYFAVNFKLSIAKIYAEPTVSFLLTCQGSCSLTKTNDVRSKRDANIDNITNLGYATLQYKYIVQKKGEIRIGKCICQIMLS